MATWGSEQANLAVSGTARGRQISMTITVPTLPLPLGPFVLVQGVTETWPACAYP